LSDKKIGMANGVSGADVFPSDKVGPKGIWRWVVAGEMLGEAGVSPAVRVVELERGMVLLSL
jgi:hypothetical protein